MAKRKTKPSASSKKPPSWLTVTPKKDSTLSMKQREYLEGLIVKHCAEKATLEKNAAKPPEEQLQKFDKNRCWHAAYSACARHILKYL